MCASWSWHLGRNDCEWAEVDGPLPGGVMPGTFCQISWLKAVSMRSDRRLAATSESDRVVSARAADNISPLLILIKALRMFLFLTLLRAIVSESLDEQEFQKAKQEYEQAVPLGNEKARLTYVSKLPQSPTAWAANFGKVDRETTKR